MLKMNVMELKKSKAMNKYQKRKQIKFKRKKRISSNENFFSFYEEKESRSLYCCSWNAEYFPIYKLLFCFWNVFRQVFFFFFLKGKNTFYIFRQIFLFINLFSGIFYRNFLVFLHFCFQKVSKESKLFKLKIFLENIFFVENFNNFLPSTLYSLCSSDTFFKSNQCHLSLPKKKKSKNFFSISRVTRQYSFFPNQSLLLIPSVRSSLK